MNQPALSVMLSYQSADARHVDLLHDEIALRGMRVLRDQATFGHGRRLDGEMAESVRSCDAFLIYLTPNSLYQHLPPDGPRPALDDEFLPALQRRRDHLAGLRAAGMTDPAAVRPVVIPICHGLGEPRSEAPRRVHQATGEDISSLWSRAIDQATEGVTRREAAEIALDTLRSLLPPSKGAAIPDDPIEVTIATRGQVAPPGKLAVDGIRLLGGPDRRAGTPEDWRRFLAALRDLESTLAAHTPVRRIRFIPRTHLSGAIATGRVFNQAAQWSVSVVGRHGVASAAPTDEGEILFDWDDGARDSRTALVEIDLLGHPVFSLANNLARTLDPRPRGRLQIRRLGEGDLSPQEVERTSAAIAALIRRHVAQKGLRRLKLMYAGPADLAILLGHRLTGMEIEIQLYERDGERYVESLLLPADLP
jgi:hypothetical protein